MTQSLAKQILRGMQGPASSVDNTIPRYDGITGKKIQGSGIVISDANVLIIGAGQGLDVSPGTFTLADNQISGDKVEGGTINAITINTLNDKVDVLGDINIGGLRGLSLGVTDVGRGNIWIGESVGLNATAVSLRNVGIGAYTLKDLTDGSYNIGIGYAAVFSITTGDYNVGIGAWAGVNIETGNSNLALGTYALYTNISGSNNFAIGNSALYFVTGASNVALGNYAGYGITSGAYNLAIGYYSVGGVTTGAGNIGVGYSALRYGSGSGAANVAIGREAGKSSGAPTLHRNTLIGAYSGRTIASGSDDNVVIGYMAGLYIAGDRNVFLGHKAGYYETGSDKLFIDNAIRASEADARTKALIYGVFAAAVADQSLTINANVGIGTTTLPATLANGLVFALGTDPTADVTDQFSHWAKDITAGNCGPAWRTEDGTVIQLDQSLLTTDSVVFGIIDISGGTLTLANNQISGDKVEGGTIAAITINALTGETASLEKTYTDLSGNLKPFEFNGNLDIAGAGTANLSVGRFVAYKKGAGNNTGYTEGFMGVAGNYGTGDLTTARGGRFQIHSLDSGDITSGYSAYILSPYLTSTGVIATQYGLYIQDQSVFTGGGGGSITNAYGIYILGNSLKNYIAGSLGIGTSTFPATLAQGLVFALGTAPTADVADQFSFWGGDIAAGNTAPHFRTEDGSVIKLYQQTHINDPAGGATQDAEARTAINDILDILENNGLMAT